MHKYVKFSFLNYYAAMELVPYTFFMRSNPGIMLYVMLLYVFYHEVSDTVLKGNKNCVVEFLDVILISYVSSPEMIKSSILKYFFLSQNYPTFSSVLIIIV